MTDRIRVSTICRIRTHAQRRKSPARNAAFLSIASPRTNIAQMSPRGVNISNRAERREVERAIFQSLDDAVAANGRPRARLSARGDEARARALVHRPNPSAQQVHSAAR